MLSVGLLIAAVACSIQAIRAPRLLVAAIWLAGVSALVALLLYLLNARELAVIELSVGAGLVTVLFVFAISMAGEDLTPLKSLISRPLALGLVGVAIVALAWLALPLAEQPAGGEPPFGTLLWNDRSADILVQIVLIFAGVLGVLGLLADEARPETAEAQTTVEMIQEAPPPLVEFAPEAEKEVV